jgi:similar to spore coat protein
MMNEMGLHETLELHELLVFKNLCLTKSVAMSGLVQDPTLKTILQDGADIDVKFVQELQSILKREHGMHE